MMNKSRLNKKLLMSLCQIQTLYDFYLKAVEIRENQNDLFVTLYFKSFFISLFFYNRGYYLPEFVSFHSDLFYYYYSLSNTASSSSSSAQKKEMAVFI